MASKILVVDDDAQIRKLLSYMLRSAGYAVIEASDGFEALAQVTTEQPDAILLDLMMPNMNGFEACSRIKAIPGFSNVPVIILSAKDQVSDKVEGFRAGATDYLTKPVERAELLARLEAHLRVAESLGTTAQPAATATQEVAHLFVVAGIKGGVGATTLATNLAYGMRRETRQDVMLIDGDVPYGDAGLALNLIAQHGLSSLNSYGDSMDRIVIDSAMVSHASGLRVLTASGASPESDPGDPEIVVRAVNVLRPTTDYIVVDTPPLVDYPIPELVQTATRLLLVLTPDIGALRRTTIALNWLDSIDLDPEKLILVLNRRGNGDISISQAERHLGRSVHYTLDEDNRVRLSFNRGVPVIHDNARAQFSKTLQQTIRSLREIPKPLIQI